LREEEETSTERIKRGKRSRKCTKRSEKIEDEAKIFLLANGRRENVGRRKKGNSARALCKGRRSILRRWEKEEDGHQTIAHWRKAKPTGGQLGGGGGAREERKRSNKACFPLQTKRGRASLAKKKERKKEIQLGDKGPGLQVR